MIGKRVQLLTIPTHDRDTGTVIALSADKQKYIVDWDHCNVYGYHLPDQLLEVFPVCDGSIPAQPSTSL